jgi:hypothetical protein
LIASAAGTTKLVGIVSFGGEVCGDSSAPGVYTRVSGELGFILQGLGLAPGPPPPSPAPPAVRAQFGNITCGAVLCNIDVTVSGDVGAIGRLVVSLARGGASPVHRSAAAVRRSAHLWRARINLPYGTLHLTGQPFTKSGAPFGRPAREDIQVSPG